MTLDHQNPCFLADRTSGLLLHITSLPGPHGIGDLGESAHVFVEFLAEARQSWWQLLPVGPTGFDGSPYQSLSTFAGNPALISLTKLADEGLLDRADVGEMGGVDPCRMDLAAASEFKQTRLQNAYKRFAAHASAEQREPFERFRTENGSWLPDYSLFHALRESHGRAPWTDWEPAVRDRKAEAIKAAHASLADEIEFAEFVQYLFAHQWSELKRRCNDKGIGLIGDIPIFLSHDSADVWAHPELFKLDEKGRPTVVAGVPPDYFSETGQLWGNPVYRWDVLARNGFDWWMDRLRAAFGRFDVVRLDHFIGFQRGWEVENGAETAEHGEFVQGPGEALFHRVREVLGDVPIIAEDLGLLTPEVMALRDKFDFPGMRVLQFSFGLDEGAQPYRPHNYPGNCVAYTGTHDNDTIVGWFHGDFKAPFKEGRDKREQMLALEYSASDGKEVNWDMIRLAWMSPANTAIAPVQDLLGLGSEARMNTPGTIEGNWSWRMWPGALTLETARRLAYITELYGRARPSET